MSSVALNTNFVKMMSSRVIAELTEKEHKNVLRDIRNMVEQLDGSELSHDNFQELKDARGYISEILLGRQLVECLITGYSPQLRMAVIKRLHELEAQVQQPTLALPNFTDPAEAAIAWAAEFKAKQLAQVQVVQLEAENQSMKTDVKALEQISKADGSLCITDAAKALQVNPKFLFVWLREHGWIYKRTGSKYDLGYQDKVQAGYLEHKVDEILLTDGRTKIREQVRITPKGLAKLAKIFAKGEVA